MVISESGIFTNKDIKFIMDFGINSFLIGENFMKSNNIGAPSHYVPLHSSPAGQKYGEMVAEDHWTTNLASRIVRLPLFYQISRNEQNIVIEKVQRFLSQRQGSVKIAA